MSKQEIVKPFSAKQMKIMADNANYTAKQEEQEYQSVIKVIQEHASEGAYECLVYERLYTANIEKLENLGFEINCKGPEVEMEENCAVETIISWKGTGK